jgi:hypothetical protein
MNAQKQKWLLLVVVLMLIAGTAGALTELKAHQRLGTPGIKATPIPGSTKMMIELPERVLDFTSTNVPESDIELGYFPPDTSYVRRCYQDSTNYFPIFNTIVLMGADRTSIHRPEFCLPGQGWRIDAKTEVKLPVQSPHAYELPVMKWFTHLSYQDQNKQTVEVSGVYVFWFVADNEQTTGIVPMQLKMVQDQLLTGVLQRWAYVSYFTVCVPGQEDATFERMAKLIASSVPEFQLPPAAKSPTSPPAKP